MGESSISKDTFQNIFNLGHWEGLDFFFDLTLRTEDGCIFKVHRVVLSQKSGFFRSLFTHEKGTEICLKDIEGNTLADILIYIYTGEAHLNENNVWNILIAADYFLLDDLLNKSISFANNNVSHKSCLLALTISWRIQRINRIKYCYRYVLVHFEELYNTQDVGILPLPALKMLLKEDSLNVSSEESVWNTIINWVEINRDERLKYIEVLLNFLRAKDVKDDLASEILNSDYVKNKSYFSNQNLETMTNYLTLGNNMLCVSHQRQPKRLHFNIVHTISHESSVSISYDHEIDYWRRVCHSHLFLDWIVIIGHVLYLFDALSIEGQAFDILNETMVPINSPNRADYIIITVGDYIFAIGGSDEEGENSLVDDMEFYDPVSNQWSSIGLFHSMETQTAVALNSCIYLIGKDDSETVVCQVYNTETGSWFVASSPISRGIYMNAESFKGKVYLYGGKEADCVEEYDPQLNAWMVLPRLPFKPSKAFDLKTLGAVGSFTDETFALCDTKGTSPPVSWDGQVWRNVEDCHEWRNLGLFVSMCTTEDSGLIEELTRRNRRKGTPWQKIKV